MTNFSEAVFIKKDIKIKDIDEENIKSDLLYLTNLYKKYENKFENAIIKINDIQDKKISGGQDITIQELNKTMLTLVEEVGKLAEMMKKLL